MGKTGGRFLTKDEINAIVMESYNQGKAAANVRDVPQAAAAAPAPVQPPVRITMVPADGQYKATIRVTGLGGKFNPSIGTHAFTLGSAERRFIQKLLTDVNVMKQYKAALQALGNE